MRRRNLAPSWERGECSIPAGCRFDGGLADRAVQFFEGAGRWPGLVHTDGQWAGKPFMLAPFQREVTREIFGRVYDNGRRVVRTAYVEVPKKNGKSGWAAGIALKLLFSDSEMSAEVYGAASDRLQASIVFDVAASMVRWNPRLSELARVIDSTKRIVFSRQASFYRALSAEVAGKHGFNTSGCIFDEVHCQRDERLWEVLTFGSGAARAQPLTFAITTAGIPGESPVAERLHAEADSILRGTAPCPENFYPVIFGAEQEDDWTSEDTWRAANPALGDFLSVENIRRDEFERAKRSLTEQNSFRRLRLNQWVSQETRAIDMDDWDRCAGPVDLREVRHLPCYAGLDLSTRQDITALLLVWSADAGVFPIAPFFWLPSQNVQDKPFMESAKYRQWAQEGRLTLTEGNAIDYGSVRRRLLELRDQAGLDIQEIGFDPWNATQLAQQLTEDGFRMVEMRQGYQTLSEPTKEVLTAVRQHSLRHGGHPILRWMADCLSVRQDENGNIRPVKPDRAKSSKRIDGMVALIMAIGRAILAREQYAEPSVRMIGDRIQ